MASVNIDNRKGRAQVLEPVRLCAERLNHSRNWLRTESGHSNIAKFDKTTGR
jgi:hypothetical protein